MRHVLVLAALICAAANPAGADDHAPAGPPKVENEKGKQTVLSPQAIAKLPRQTVEVKDAKGNAVKYEGVSVAEVLRLAGVTLGKELRGPLLANFLLAEAADGYRVVFALPEVDPDMTEKIVLLADRKDGKPLPANEGPYRLVVPGDKRNMRWVRQVARLSVRNGAPAAGKEKP
jgi:DMSO/TMAO reductase YedYZ molybdopterin-dependent catalytic subunit